MEKGYTMEIERRLFDNDNGAFVSVGMSADFPGNVRLYTTKENAEMFGDIRLDLPWKMMKLIGEALIQASREAELAGD